MCIRDRVSTQSTGGSKSDEMAPRTAPTLITARLAVPLVAAAAALLSPAAASTQCDGCTQANWLTYPGCTLYTGSCGALESETDCWSGSYCYAASSGSCCETDSGATAGLAIGLVLGTILIVFVSCFCCDSCPLKRACCKSSNPQHTPAAPAMVYTQQGQPVVYQQQPIQQPVYVQQPVYSQPAPVTQPPPIMKTQP
eukprot:TRINITY_DN14552_c0_g1_i2.p1 TRINITY_DN14552_c0_g1~~TRINITY_DN14552_c0_g1_i2.p1  ORF type:complete len:197 (+),score=40.94 TRINITY_DN14552_c0_g1_i2:170-760(+)